MPRADGSARVRTRLWCRLEGAAGEDRQYGPAGLARLIRWLSEESGASTAAGGFGFIHSPFASSSNTLSFLDGLSWGGCRPDHFAKMRPALLQFPSPPNSFLLDR